VRFHHARDALVVDPVFRCGAVVELGGDPWRPVGLVLLVHGTDPRGERGVSCGPCSPAGCGRLAKTLVTSNPAESMISIARTTNRNVTRWRDGHMVLRWTAAGMLNAERSFRRIKGYKQMPQLVEALHRHAHPETALSNETVGAAA
jgi:hypothetical protein